MSLWLSEIVSDIVVRGDVRSPSVVFESHLLVVFAVCRPPSVVCCLSCSCLLWAVICRLWYGNIMSCNVEGGKIPPKVIHVLNLQKKWIARNLVL